MLKGMSLAFGRTEGFALRQKSCLEVGLPAITSSHGSLSGLRIRKEALGATQAFRKSFQKGIDVKSSRGEDGKRRCWHSPVPVTSRRLRVDVSLESFSGLNRVSCVSDE